MTFSTKTNGHTYDHISIRRRENLYTSVTNLLYMLYHVTSIFTKRAREHVFLRSKTPLATSARATSTWPTAPHLSLLSWHRTRSHSPPTQSRPTRSVASRKPRGLRCLSRGYWAWAEAHYLFSLRPRAFTNRPSRTVFRASSPSTSRGRSDSGLLGSPRGSRPRLCTEAQEGLLCILSNLWVLRSERELLIFLHLAWSSTPPLARALLLIQVPKKQKINWIIPTL